MYRGLAAILAAALKRAEDFNTKANGSGLRKGVGMATCWYGCGNTSIAEPNRPFAMGITPDGKIVLHQGAMDIGQGSNTVIAQIAADALWHPPCTRLN